MAPSKDRRMDSVDTELQETSRPDATSNVDSCTVPYEEMQEVNDHHTNGVANRRCACQKVLRQYADSVRFIIFSQYCLQTMTAITLGALFDAYLLVLQGTNSFVGTVESARGLSALAVAFPLGWIADRCRKSLVLRWNLMLGICAVLLLAIGIPNNIIPFIFAGSVFSAVHNQCCAGIFAPLISEQIEVGHSRMHAMSHLQTAASLGQASGPAMQILLIWIFQTRHWTSEELHWVLCSGLLLFGMFAPLIWCIDSNMQEVCGSNVMAGPSVESIGSASQPTSKRRWCIALAVELSSFVTAIGSGMTFKFWPLFFKGDFGFSPFSVCCLQLAIWLSIAVSSQGVAHIAKKWGRALTCFVMHWFSTILLFVVSKCTGMGTFLTVTVVLLRNAGINAAGPLLTSIVMDSVPRQHRGKWGAFMSLRRMTWSGSAFVGGLLSDNHDYRYAFFITACLHSCAGVVLALVVLLQPDRES